MNFCLQVDREEVDDNGADLDNKLLLAAREDELRRKNSGLSVLKTDKSVDLENPEEQVSPKQTIEDKPDKVDNATPPEIELPVPDNQPPSLAADKEPVIEVLSEY